MLKLELPLGIRTKSETRNGFALGLNRQHFSGVVENRRSRGLFGAGPFCIGQRTQSRRSFAIANVPRNQISLLEWHVEFRFIGELEGEHILFANRSRRRTFCEL